MRNKPSPDNQADDQGLNAALFRMNFMSLNVGLAKTVEVVKIGAEPRSQN